MKRLPTIGMSAPLAQQVRDGAEVVLVPVREHDGLDVVEAVPDVGEVRQDQVDPGLVVLREQHAAVDDEQPAGVLEDGHVAADLAEAAERDDAQAAVGQRRAAGRARGAGGSCDGHAAGREVGARARRAAPSVASTSGRRTGPTGPARAGRARP